MGKLWLRHGHQPPHLVTERRAACQPRVHGLSLRCPGARVRQGNHGPMAFRPPSSREIHRQRFRPGRLRGDRRSQRGTEEGACRQLLRQLPVCRGKLHPPVAASRPGVLPCHPGASHRHAPSTAFRRCGCRRHPDVRRRALLRLPWQHHPRHLVQPAWRL